MVLCGKVNKDITGLIQKAGGKALGLCGIDGAMLQGRQIKAQGEDLGFVGEISQVNTALLEATLDQGYVPVISTVAIDLEAESVQVLNINADPAAAKIAAALGAEKLILMTDVQGILKDVQNPASLIKVANLDELETLRAEGIVSKGMIPKVDCCRLALEGGVKKAYIIDGRMPHALLLELFTDEGIGTMIEQRNDL